jgi:hypothetical protein
MNLDLGGLPLDKYDTPATGQGALRSRQDANHSDGYRSDEGAGLHR